MWEIATLKAHIDEIGTLNAQKMDEIATLNDEIGTLKAQLAEVIQVQGVAAAEEAARAVDKEEVEALCVCVCVCVCVVCMYVCMYVYTCCVLIKPPIPYITSSRLCLLRVFAS